MAEEMATSSAVHISVGELTITATLPLVFEPTHLSFVLLYI